MNVTCLGQVSTRSTSIPLDSFTHVSTDSQSKMLYTFLYIYIHKTQLYKKRIIIQCFMQSYQTCETLLPEPVGLPEPLLPVLWLITATAFFILFPAAFVTAEVALCTLLLVLVAVADVSAL
jgi:hypothetical protein